MKSQLTIYWKYSVKKKIQKIDCNVSGVLKIRSSRSQNSKFNLKTFLVSLLLYGKQIKKNKKVKPVQIVCLGYTYPVNFSV